MESHTLKYTAINGYPSECSVEIYRRSGLVLVTDIDCGMSVTNACDVIAREIASRYSVDSHKMIFIERYRPGRPDQTTDLVRFELSEKKEFWHPRWIHLSKEEFEEMITIAQETE